MILITLLMLNTINIESSLDEIPLKTGLEIARGREGVPFEDLDYEAITEDYVIKGYDKNAHYLRFDFKSMNDSTYFLVLNFPHIETECFSIPSGAADVSPSGPWPGYDVHQIQFKKDSAGYIY